MSGSFRALQTQWLHYSKLWVSNLWLGILKARLLLLMIGNVPGCHWIGAGMHNSPHDEALSIILVQLKHQNFMHTTSHNSEYDSMRSMAPAVDSFPQTNRKLRRPLCLDHSSALLSVLLKWNKSIHIFSVIPDDHWYRLLINASLSAQTVLGRC